MVTKKLTNKDVPFLRECLHLWQELFGVPLDRGQLIIWAEQYPQDAIRKSFGITKGWTDRKPYGNDGIPEREAYRYCTGVLRHLYEAYAKADKLLGVEL